MEEGMLDIKGDMLYFVVPGVTSIPLQYGARLEIYLGEHWIAGIFKYCTKRDRAPIELRLVCTNQSERPSFCGLLSGMTARVHLEEVIKAVLPQESIGPQSLEALPESTWESEEAQGA